MSWMNEHEIDEAVRILAGTEMEPYAEYLSQWRTIINDNSDGWPYWTAGSSAAAKLMDVLDRALTAQRRNRDEEMPAAEEAAATLRYIKSAATRHGIPQPDVDGI